MVQGGLAIPGGCGVDAQAEIIMANAAAIVSLDVGDYLAFKRSEAGGSGEGPAVADAASQSDEPGGAAGEGSGMSAAEAEAILAKHFVIDQLKGRQ